ncbi:MAG TPA: non-canonical purine NTP pyrophosphatase, partial [Xanthobacteraceae bacterium]
MSDDRPFVEKGRKITSGEHYSSADIRHPTSDIRALTSDRLVIATHNPGKLAEMRELLAPYGIAAILAGELALAEPDENGMTFLENACIKAATAAKAAKLPALADDSGLVVEALDGAPGIHSARWAGSDRNFHRAMEMIEQELRARGAATPGHRQAHFVSALCL